MKVAFIGCVIFSESALKSLLRHPDAQVVGVITRASSPINADFVDLAPLATEAGVPYCRVEGNDQVAMLEALQAWQPDVVYCFGWSYLLNERILDLPPKGVIGFHPAALPANRGRHPIIWALALGLERTASTFFVMEPAADSGPIVSQEPVEIGEEDDAGSLYRRITEVALDQVDALTHALATGRVEALPQDSTRASHWRKRGPADGTIDWRMPARGIVNLVRALAPPYVGADCITVDGMAKVWEAREYTGEVAPNHEPGKVLSVTPGSLLVKCGDGAVEIVRHDIRSVPGEGGYLPVGTPRTAARRASRTGARATGRTKRVAIHQPHYLPWPGYFDKVRQCDLFVYLDNVQFQRRGFQNRNRIKTCNSAPWLTVPVHADRESRIDKVMIADEKWRKRHITAIENAYAHAPHVRLFHDGLRSIIAEAPGRLVDLNILVSDWVMSCLGIETPTLRASSLDVSGHKEQLILEICERVGATHYLSGQGARCYQEVEHFAQRGLVLEYHSADVSPYPQCHPTNGFVHGLSTLDLLLNTGDRALDYVHGRLETL